LRKARRSSDTAHAISSNASKKQVLNFLAFLLQSTNTDAELAVGELAKLAELTAHSEEPRKKTPMLHTLLERREFLLAEMQEKLRAAREEVVLL
jgi:hypothetical protein